MDSSSQFLVPTIIDVPELIVTNEDLDYDDSIGFRSGESVWFNKLEFLASALSYIIGLANLWRFPYLCYKHAGGAFLIAYTLILIIVGLPLFLMELAFGQYANEGPITIWRISPAFEGIGYSMCLISAMVAIYFNIINTWLLNYLFVSILNLFSGTQVPWSTCNNSWNTESCFFSPDRVSTFDNVDMVLHRNESFNTFNCSQYVNSNSTMPSLTSTTLSSLVNTQLIDPDILLASNATIGLLINNNSNSFNNCSIQQQQPPISINSFDKIINTTIEVTLPANEYFHNHILGLTNSINQFGNLNWNILFGLIIVWGADFLIVLKNFRPISSGTALSALVMAYLTLIAIFVRAITLPGSTVGISYYFTPNWSKFQNIDIWLDATTQILFSFSPCWGGVITLANMNKFHTNFHANTILIVLINYITSLAAGLVTFAIIGYMSNYSGVSIDEVADSGLGFIFLVYTEALAQLPLAGINSFIFFAILIFLGFNSQLVVMETVITTIVDTWPHKLRYRRPLVLMILCTIMFIISLTTCFGNGFYVTQLFDTFSGTFTAIILGILELLVIAWVYGLENFMQDIDDMISFHKSLFPSRSYWCFMWRYLTPSVLFAILLFAFTDLEAPSYRHSSLPNWTMKFGWILTIVCVSIVPLLAIIRLLLLSPRGTSFVDKISYLCRPSEDWAPSAYVSGPKLINNRHHHHHNPDLDDSDLSLGGQHASLYMSRRQTPTFSDVDDQDQESNDSNEDLKVVDGRANYIIPEEEDDTDTGLITSETNV